MVKTTIDGLNALLKQQEGCCLEFKTAKNNFSDSNLTDYCAAISNEGGGKLILGVDNEKIIRGTNVFQGNYQTLSHELLQKLKIRVDVEELYHPEGRVLIFDIPSHPHGQPIKSTGKYKYPMRAGESLVEMDTMTLRRLLIEVEPDFSDQLVNGFSLDDLNEQAIDNFRKLWAKKQRRPEYETYATDKTLMAIGLLADKGLNYASLILFGKKEKIDKLIPCSEIIFEWRQDAGKTAYDFRKNWREPFFKIYNEVWNAINNRNMRIPFQEGLFQREIYAFNEKTIREALLNAVAHRDYSINNASIFIKASPQEFVIDSPGGFPSGITKENILYKSCWRNRRIAEVFEKAGLVERSGQGMDDIFASTIREGKGLPDLSESDNFLVRLKVPAQVKDKNFILFLEKVTDEKQIIFSFDEIYELEKVREQQKVTDIKYKEKFLDFGIIERIGKTRGAKYILSHKYYRHEGKVGVHTRLFGIARDKQKEFILRHLEKNAKGFFKDFQDIFPELKRTDIANLLQELKREGKIKHEGSSKNGFWKLLK